MSKLSWLTPLPVIFAHAQFSLPAHSSFETDTSVLIS